MKNFSKDPDFLDLIAALHGNADFSTSRIEELLARLKSNPEMRRALASEVQMASLAKVVQRGETRWLELEEILGKDSDQDQDLEATVMHRIDRSESDQRKRRQSTVSRRWLGIAAAAAIAILGLFVLLNSSETDHDSVARVIRIDGELKNDAGRVITINDRLKVGEKLLMASGLVELAFIETGVHVLASGPLDLTTDSRSRISVHDGEVKLHVPPQGIGFVVETPERKITDLGTSFVVTTREQGSRVLVLDGEIAIGDGKGGEERLMYEGDLADFDQDGGVKLRSQQGSGLPDRSVASLEPSSSSLSGNLYSFKSRPEGYQEGADVIGEKFLPLVRSQFKDMSNLGDLIKSQPFRFTGLVGNYNQFPNSVNAEPFAAACGWVAWYNGPVLPPQPGKYRFWGYADNHLLVAIDGKAVFEGSRYESLLRNRLGIPRRNHPSLPCLNSTAGFASGEWFEVGDKAVDIDILFGELSGSLTSSILLIERQGGSYDETFWGQPEWPLFIVEPPSEPEIRELQSLRRHMRRKLMASFGIDSTELWAAKN